jgi:transcriptional regulator with XRE-family HTH domain
MRNFRIRHGISLQDVAAAAGKSHQWASRAELGHIPATNHISSIVSNALYQIVQQRKQEAALLEADYAALKDRILEEEIEWTPP